MSDFIVKRGKDFLQGENGWLSEDHSGLKLARRFRTAKEAQQVAAQWENAKVIAEWLIQSHD